jgi:hypothetical protein
MTRATAEVGSLSWTDLGRHIYTLDGEHMGCLELIQHESPNRVRLLCRAAGQPVARSYQATDRVAFAPATKEN